MNELNIIIRTDGTFVNAETGDVLTLKQVITSARERREAASAELKTKRAEQKKERAAKRIKRLEERAAKVAAELAKAKLAA